ncbi:MAG: efflux RND transporter periplasmic adaptor subunit [Gemmatimonadales bacterium]|jgi:HlyD family secretion protein|nr:MAG: efflux RND transporter periplasmic adaptor subunit [Gemmatimonadales bacterium]
MSRRTKFGLIAGILIVVVGGLFFLTAASRNKRAVEVRFDTVQPQDLVASVTASGRIEPQTKVDISADITGRITQIAVKEGDWVKKGQFLLQIDPSQYEASVARAEALLSASTASQVQARANYDQAERTVGRAKELSTSSPNLISTEAVEQAQTAFDVAKANLNAANAQMAQNRATLQDSKDQLAKTRLISPLDGRVTRLNVEVGEVAVPGTFSRETALLMTVADLSVILAKVQVDETDVVRLALGDSVRVTIDAFPDTAFVGRVTEISNSAQLTATATAGGSSDRAVDFDVEVTISNPPADIRPDLSATAKVITDTRTQVPSVPIIALTVRPHEVVPNESAPSGSEAADTSEKKMVDTEGVFVVREGIATFTPVKVGIAGEEYFEVVSGVQLGDSIVAGTYQTIRDLQDSAKVRAAKIPAPGGGNK